MKNLVKFVSVSLLYSVLSLSGDLENACLLFLAKGQVRMWLVVFSSIGLYRVLKTLAVSMRLTPTNSILCSHTEIITSRAFKLLIWK